MTKRELEARKAVKIQDLATAWVSISLPQEVYLARETIAKKKRVKLAWVARDAVEMYIADKRPLIAGPTGD